MKLAYMYYNVSLMLSVNVLALGYKYSMHATLQPRIRVYGLKTKRFQQTTYNDFIKIISSLSLKFLVESR
jgi:hypothetical protein